MNDWLKSYCNNEGYDVVRNYSFWARESGREDGYEDGMLTAARKWLVKICLLKKSVI